MNKLKRITIKVCGWIEFLLDLIIFGYGPVVVYDLLLERAYVEGTLLAMAIGAIAHITYHEPRCREAVMSRFFNLMMFWEGVKMKYKLGDYRD